MSVLSIFFALSLFAGARSLRCAIDDKEGKISIQSDPSWVYCTIEFSVDSHPRLSYGSDAIQDLSAANFTFSQSTPLVQQRIFCNQEVVRYDYLQANLAPASQFKCYCTTPSCNMATSLEAFLARNQ